MSDFKVPVHRRLGFRLGLTAALLSCAVFSATGWLVLQNQQETLTRALTSRVLATTRSLGVASAPLLMRRDPELQLNPLILRALRENPDLEDITILDSNGVIRGHRDLLAIGKPYQIPTPGQAIDVELADGESAWRTREHVVIVQPILQHDRESGVMVARARFDGISTAVASLVQPMILLALGGMLVLARSAVDDRQCPRQLVQDVRHVLGESPQRMAHDDQVEILAQRADRILFGHALRVRRCRRIASKRQPLPLR